MAQVATGDYTTIFMSNKNKFHLVGSKTLIDAFEQELISLGYNGDTCQGDENTIAFYGNSYHKNYYLSCMSHVGDRYNLPQDWGKVLELIQPTKVEYVKCTHSNHHSWTVGRVYKVEGEVSDTLPIISDEKVLVDVSLWNTNNPNINCFEPSTKEAYDEQEKIKVGDWVTVIDDSNDDEKANYSPFRNGDTFLVLSIEDSIHEHT